ncbi:hypothetical protein [Rhizobium leguminosarum]|uniref:hypothetical protein n=1 Tax=Rhizobium leguminosarum TaxID=384 RepID=UPI001C957998|nr:hypothetical protein [Rhizobium leguminosarum]MBY5377251.1 hypothetical protein [Rhizobium leguminosarum]
MSLPDQETPSLPRRQTDPVWLQDHFLHTGHTEETSSATFTFVKHKNQVYAVTCGHVLDAIKDEEVVPGAKFPTLALQIDRAVLNLSTFIAASQIEYAVKAPKFKDERREVDIAIAKLSDHYWSLMTEKKQKTAIDLDSWREPDWDKVKFCLAAGYPDEHKAQVEDGGRDMVSAPFATVVVEFADRSPTVITLSSELDQPHNYYFSGMSGGPVYAAEGLGEIEDYDLFPVGIIYQGYPGSGRRSGNPDTSASFFTERDIFFRALALTPDTFDDWLRQSHAI